MENRTPIRRGVLPATLVTLAPLLWAIDIAALLCIGAVGYGLSLRITLRAQRIIGAARTASVFAAAPFVGAAVALVIGAGTRGWPLASSAALILAGVWLHASEHHRHRHEAIEHEHEHGEDLHHIHPH